ncbi:16S rRNA (guanine(527)-N(7))-methyltransferase RsmG [soil metagenome]
MNTIERAARYAGMGLDAQQLVQLSQFSQWLGEEAADGGGIGPNEVDRIGSRHVADSLLFAAGWVAPRPPPTLLDLGSGVGLPGIPLAIAWPETEVRLLDRSRRRQDLARRAVRMLEVSATVVDADASTYGGPGADMVVSRAAGDPATVLQWCRRLLIPGGMAVVGGSHLERPSSVAGERVMEVPATVLDRPVWLRMMATT